MGGIAQVELRTDEPTFLADPYPTYAALRERYPVFRTPDSALVYFTRHADITRLLQDARLGRTLDHTLRPGEVAQKRRGARWEALPCYSRYVRVNLLETEGADHARVRAVLTQVINPARIRALRERVQHSVDSLLNAVAARGEMEFIADVAEPLPVRVIADWLGWPESDRHRLRPWSAAIVRLYEADHTDDDAQGAERATREFAAMIEQLVAARRGDPRDDLVSALAAVEGRPDGLSRDELIATCMLVLNAGHEATVNAAGNGLLALLRHAEQLTRLCAEPALLRPAVEEMLRYDAPLQLFKRVVVEDFEYAGAALHRGEEVALLYGCANRDANAFAHPDRFDVARRPNQHLAFGGGRHYCSGASLARLELEVLFGMLLARFPSLVLNGTPERRPGFIFRGLHRLPVRLG
jgi:cytochrome P450